MTDGVAIATAAHGGVVSVAGELDAVTCPPVREAAEHVDRSSAARSRVARTGPIVRAGPVQLRSIGGVGDVLEVAARAAGSGLALTLVVAPEGALDTQLQRTGLATQFTVRPAAVEDGPPEVRGS